MSGGPFNDAMPIAEARSTLRSLAREGGHKCPICLRMTKVRRRGMTSVPARAVAALYKHHGRQYAHMPTIVQAHLADVATQGGYATLGAHWDLIQEERIQRPDGGRAGYWSLTDLGESWLQGEATVPKYVDIFDGHRLGEPYGDPVTARQVLETHFDLIPLRESASGPYPTDALFPESEAA